MIPGIVTPSLPLGGPLGPMPFAGAVACAEVAAAKGSAAQGVAVPGSTPQAAATPKATRQVKATTASVTAAMLSDDAEAAEAVERAFAFVTLLLSDLHEIKSLPMQLLAFPRQESLHQVLLEAGKKGHI